MQLSAGRVSRRRNVVAAVLALAVLWPAGQSVASTAEPVERHCVTRVETAETACFDTFSAAVHAATAGLVDLPPGARPDVTSAAFRRQVAVAGAAASQGRTPQVGQLSLAAVWLSVEYSLPNYAGSSWITTAGSACDDSPDYDHATASLAGSGWDDEVSSFVGFSRCQVEHWTGYSFTGAVNYGSQDPVFPWQVDNQTSSLRFY